LDPMGKMFQNTSSLKPLGQLKPYCPGIIIWRSSKKFGFFMPIRNPRWLPPQVIVLTQDPMGKYRNIFFSEAIALIEPKLCINHWKVLYKRRVIYVDRNSKMTTTAEHSFYIGPIGSFYNQVNDTRSWEPLVIYFYILFIYLYFFFTSVFKYQVHHKSFH
jgi:hypothetical protein